MTIALYELDEVDEEFGLTGIECQLEDKITEYELASKERGDEVTEFVLCPIEEECNELDAKVEDPKDGIFKDLDQHMEDQKNVFGPLPDVPTMEQKGEQR